jgi:L-arabinose isomerase
MNIGIVGHTFQGMYDLELDKTKLKAAIGPNVVYVELNDLLALWRDVPEEEAGRVALDLAAQYTIAGPQEEDLRNSCRLGLAMERLAEKHNLSGLSHLCQHLIHVETGTTPCYAAARLTEKGIMVTCEGDIGNLVCMCLLHELTGDIPCFFEWGMYDVKENAMLLVHHGSGSPRLAKCAADVNITPTGEKWGFKGTGASFRYMGKPGPVTMASLIEDRQGWKMLITGGEAIDVPCRPFWGQQFMVRVDQPVKTFLETLCREGVTHHGILIYGDLREKLQKAVTLLGIRQFSV